MSGDAPVQPAEKKTFWQKFKLEIDWKKIKWWILGPMIAFIVIGIIGGIVASVNGIRNKHNSIYTCTRTVNGVRVPCDKDTDTPTDTPINTPTDTHKSTPTGTYTCTKTVNGVQVPCDS